MPTCLSGTPSHRQHRTLSDPRHDVYRPYRCVVVAYVRLPPPLDQRDAVEHYWMVEAPRLPFGGQARDPDPQWPAGSGDRVGRARCAPGSSDSERWTNDAALFGLMTRPHVLSQTGMSSYVGAELKPWGIAALGLSDRLVDGVLPVAAWTDAGTTRRLARELADLEFGQPRADRLAGLGTAAVVDSVVVARCGDRGGTRYVSVAELARRSSLVQHLYRVPRAVGFGPKQFGEIVRYYHFVGGLLGGPADAQATLAALTGTTTRPMRPGTSSGTRESAPVRSRPCRKASPS